MQIEQNRLSLIARQVHLWTSQCNINLRVNHIAHQNVIIRQINYTLQSKATPIDFPIPKNIKYNQYNPLSPPK